MIAMLIVWCRSKNLAVSVDLLTTVKISRQQLILKRTSRGVSRTVSQLVLSLSSIKGQFDASPQIKRHNSCLRIRGSNGEVKIVSIATVKRHWWPLLLQLLRRKKPSILEKIYTLKSSCLKFLCFGKLLLISTCRLLSKLYL